MATRVAELGQRRARRDGRAHESRLQLVVLDIVVLLTIGLLIAAVTLAVGQYFGLPQVDLTPMWFGVDWV